MIARLLCSIGVALLVASPAAAECVNINTASYEELLRIIHIGPERAAEVIRLPAVRVLRQSGARDRHRAKPARRHQARRHRVCVVPVERARPNDGTVTKPESDAARTSTEPGSISVAEPGASPDCRSRHAQHRLA